MCEEGRWPRMVQGEGGPHPCRVFKWSNTCLLWFPQIIVFKAVWNERILHAAGEGYYEHAGRQFVFGLLGTGSLYSTTRLFVIPGWAGWTDVTMGHDCVNTHQPEYSTSFNLTLTQSNTKEKDGGERTLPFKHLGLVRFSLLCSPRRHLFNQKYSKKITIVKYYYKFKISSFIF